MEAIKQTFQRCKAEKRVSRRQPHPQTPTLNFYKGHELVLVPPPPNHADNARHSQQSALVTYVTAGYPKPEDTADICLSMERGGAGTPHQASSVATVLARLLTQACFPRYH